MRKIKIKIRVPHMSTLKGYRYYYFDCKITNNVWQNVVTFLKISVLS